MRKNAQRQIGKAVLGKRPLRGHDHTTGDSRQCFGRDGDGGELIQSRIELNALHVMLQDERKGIVEELEAQAQTMQQRTSTT
ncbi:hypothetical protein E4U19_004822 [Claviceps sp. Clav32 group G5]|nr:hypothetical protein E4U19_004822 [Claviceps sp. Clav32 group G5]